MRGREMLDTIENLNPAYIEAAAEKPKAKKNWLAQMGCYGCLFVPCRSGCICCSCFYGRTRRTTASKFGFCNSLC